MRIESNNVKLSPEERLKLLIGDLHFQVAFLSARIDELTRTEPAPEASPLHAGNGIDRDEKRAD